MQIAKLAETFFNLQVMQQYLPKIVDGFFLTIQLALAVVITGIACGLALALVRAGRIRLINFFIVLFVDMLRALPPLVLIIIFYFALPAAGIRMSGFVATWLALSLVLTAFAEEIFWAGILAVPKGQWEAARSTGLNFVEALRYVVLPQAVRITIPPLTNRTIAVTKGTALGAVAEGVVTAGGRVLNVTGLGPTPAEARDHAYAAAELIEFDGKQMRTDIAERAVDSVAAG